MTGFKPGDKVRLKENIWFIQNDKAGDVVTLEARVSHDGWDTTPEGFYLEDEFELVEEPEEPEVKGMFKVGDKVRILSNEVRPHKVGDVGVIIEADSTPDCPCAYVTVGRKAWWYDTRDLEAVAPEVAPVEAPTAPAFGMTPDALAEYVQDFITAARARVTGIGAEQYAGNGSQKFEHMSLKELIQMSREEAQDLGVYAAMLDIKLQRLEALLNEKGISVVNL